MKTTYTILNRKSPFFILAGIFAFILTSCGASQQGVVTSNDGIYEVEDDVVITEDDNAKANYYKQYFQSKENAYSDLPEDGAIFTDIEAYSTTESVDEYGNIVIEENNEGYGAWGDNPENITLVVNNYGGFQNPYWGGFYGGWGFNSFWGNPYWGGVGYWGNPYWGYGGYWNSPWYGGFYNGWYAPYFHGGYGYGYGYHNYAYAYNRGRRNTDYLAGRNASRRNAYTSRNNSRRFDGRTNSRGNSRPNMSNSRTNPRGTGITRPSNSRTKATRPSNRGNSRAINRPSRPSRPNMTRPSTSRGGGTMRGGSSRGGSRSGSVSRGGSRRGGGRG